MFKVFSAFLCVGFCLTATAHAQNYITYDEIALSVSDEPAPARTLIYPSENRMAVSQRMATKYFLELSTGRKVEFSERRYALLAVLYKTRTELQSADELNRLLQLEFGFTVSDWTEEVAGLNAQIFKAFGRPLILQQNDETGPRFKIASTQLSVYGEDTLFALHEDGSHVTFRGKSIELSARQFEIVATLARAPGKSMSYAAMREALGLSPGSQRHLENSALINAKVFRTTGANLVVAERGKMHLDLTPMPRFPSGMKIVTVRGQALELGPMQQQVFEVLGLAGLPLNWELTINYDQFSRSGLNPVEMKTALRALNRKYVETFGEPLLKIAAEDFNSSGNRFIIYWVEDDFHNTFSLKDARRRCEDRLASALQFQ